MKTLRPVLLLCLAWSCAPRPGAVGFLFVRVTWEPTVAARCFVVRATAAGLAPRTTKPMLRGSGSGPLEVAIFRDDGPAEVSLEALGYADEACSQPTGEQSQPRTASFVTRLGDSSLELRVLPLPLVAGSDLDGDGSPTPQDCDDGNALISPAFAEQCGDTFDNDCDGASDCDDTDCLGRTCGLGRACVGTNCGEAACSNGVDDDGDGLLDCADPDCAQQPCGVGGTCGAGRCLAPTEARCDDGDDNDGNGLTDCADPQCSGRACSDGDGCTQGETCQGTLCTGGAARDCSLGLPACLLNLGCDAGLCLARAAPAGASCNGPCTVGGRCDGDGGCTAAPVSCPGAPGPCFGAGSCQVALDGGCSYPVVTTNTCSDGDGCTTSDRCQADGGCAGTPLDCTPIQECRTWAHTCTAGSCDFVPRAGLPCDGGSCNAAGTCIAGGTSWPWAPANFDPSASPVPDGGIVVDCLDLVLDTEPTPSTLTANGCSPAAVLPGPGTVVQLPNGRGEALLLSASALFVDAGSRLTVVGTRPVIFAVSGDVIIAGQLWAAARGNRPAAGADLALACTGATGASGTTGTDSGPGGSGGAFGSPGGAGGPGSGNAGTAPAATTSVGSSTLEPLQGGCSGGAGSGSGGGSRGRAGGGLQLSTTGSLVVSGLIGAPGEGGGGAAAGTFGGGGAGSGGGVLLEATSLRLAATARVLALGGGGGEGSATLAGAPGADGSGTDGVAAPGGAGASPRGGQGGAGASRSAAAQAGGAGTLFGAGGGGGAGLGRVRFHVSGSCTLVAGSLVSPQQSSADGGCP